MASRLQGLTREVGTDIVLSRETAERWKEAFSMNLFPPKVKGRSRPVEIRGLA